jgi:hypothetical protein
MAAVSWCAGEVKLILQSLLFPIYQCHEQFYAMIPPPRIKLSSEFPTASLTFLVTSPQVSNFPSFVIREKSDVYLLMALVICDLLWDCWRSIMAYGSVEETIHAFLISELDGSEWRVSRFGRFTPHTYWVTGWVGPCTGPEDKAGEVQNVKLIRTFFGEQNLHKGYFQSCADYFEESCRNCQNLAPRANRIVSPVVQEW